MTTKGSDVGDSDNDIIDGVIDLDDNNYAVDNDYLDNDDTYDSDMVDSDEDGDDDDATGNDGYQRRLPLPKHNFHTWPD